MAVGKSAVRGVDDDFGMTQNFIAVDREQAFLMPPSLRDWLGEDHLAWTVLAAVAEMDLTALYGAYRADGHGRPAHTPPGHAHPPDRSHRTPPNPAPSRCPAKTTRNDPPAANPANSAATTTPDHDHTTKSSEASQKSLKTAGQHPLCATASRERSSGRVSALVFRLSLDEGSLML
jgi:hypothetical protein